MTGRDTTRRWSWAVTRTRRWQSVRHAVLERDGWACTSCGARRRLEVHHVQSVRTAPALGFDPGNCTTLCASCHTTITNAEIRGTAPDPERQKWRKAVASMAAKPSSTRI
jgi:5-methylcytosine-specific restriction endonuclease McrA